MFFCLIIGLIASETMHHPDRIIANFLLKRESVAGVLFLLFNYGLRQLRPQLLIVLNNTMTNCVVILSHFIIGQYPNKKVVCFIAMSFLSVIVMVIPILVLPENLIFPEVSSETRQKDYALHVKLFILVPCFYRAIMTLYLKRFAVRINQPRTQATFLSSAAWS